MTDNSLNSIVMRVQSAYDIIAPTYEQRNGNTLSPQLVKLAQTMVSQLGAHASILDIGCGVGRDMAWFEQQNIQVTGVDLSSGMLALARRRTSGKLVQAEMSQLPFGLAQFDGVWCCASLLHIPKAQSTYVLREIRRIMRKDGFVMFSIQAGTGEQWDGGYADGITRFFARYQPKEFQQKLERAGFIVTEWNQDTSTTRPWLTFSCTC